ncbi:MAG: tetratricopeptide repeat protein [Geobacteraceae bacterium]|nr:tetratricopeptide repeat protein [Geobacteraceae bacterium]
MSTTVSSSEKMFSALLQQQTLRDQAATNALSSGMALFQKKRYSEAIASFKQATAFKPEMVDAYNYMGMTYLKQGKNKEAIEAYKMSLKVDRNQEQVYTDLGNIYFSEQRYSEAEEAYKNAARINPASTLAPYSLGQIYLKTDRYADAEVQFKKVQRMTPKDGNVYFALGQTYNKMGRYDEAASQLEQAVTLKKDFAYAHLELGTAYLQLGQKDKAQEQLAILKELDTGLAETLQADLKTPKILTSNTDKSTFNSLLGPGSSLVLLDPAFLEPYASKDLTMTLQFDSEMDAASVMKVTNWSISKATGGTGGYYNNGYTPHPENEIDFNPIPKSVMYDAVNLRATVTFNLSQNEDGTGIIDPSHLVFKFSGTDIYGKQMDPDADEYDGFAKEGF